jgi:hypothetical protein
MLDALPVTYFGDIFSPGGAGSAITSISGGGQIKNITDLGFYQCNALTSIKLDGVTNLSSFCFYNCTTIESVEFPSVLSIGDGCFDGCSSLKYAKIPKVSHTAIGVFANCLTLTNVFISVDAPAETAEVFLNITPNQVSIIVDNPTATGWGATWNGMPVVRKTVNAGTVITIGDISAGGNVEAATYTKNGVPFEGGENAVTNISVTGQASATRTGGNVSIVVSNQTADLTGVAYTESNQTFTGVNIFTNTTTFSSVISSNNVESYGRFRARSGSNYGDFYHNGSQTVLNSQNGNGYIQQGGTLVAFWDVLSFSMNTGKYLGFGASSEVQASYTASGFIVNTKSLYGGVIKNTIFPFGSLIASNSVVSSRFDLLPAIGTNNAYLFSNGTNLFFVNVNAVTNQLTTN